MDLRISDLDKNLKTHVMHALDDLLICLAVVMLPTGEACASSLLYSYKNVTFI